jgi:hypothetical protein
MPRPDEDLEDDDELDDEEDDEDEDEDLEDDELDDEEDDDPDGETEDFTEQLEQAILDGLEGVDTIDNRGTSLRVKTIDGDTFVVTIQKEE